MIARLSFQSARSLHVAEFSVGVNTLYDIEASIRGKPAAARIRIRQEKARPLLQIYEAWLRARLETLSSKSDTAKAINYSLNQWRALTLYCEDGTLEIDNNIAENALRCVSLGRKNFLFAGSDSGGERAAAMYSLIGTCASTTLIRALT